MGVMAMRSIPEGLSTATPYLIVQDGNGAIEFYQKAFGATLKERMEDGQGRLRHAEFRIGNSMFMLGEYPGLQVPAPGGFPSLSIYLYVDDADAVHRRAVTAGATSCGEVKDQYYGDRQGGVRDPYGITWWIATHIEDVSNEELQRRMAARAGA